MRVSLAVAAGAWLVMVAAQLTGRAGELHHDVLIEAGLPLWMATPAFLAGWVFMAAAMMLPASVPALQVLEARLTSARSWSLAPMAFHATFFAVWAVFGLTAFLGDVALHRLADGTPWLADRPWLVEASALALAGAYQFTPQKLRGLARCRHPADLSSPIAGTAGGARLGSTHALDCLASSGPLMLLMFAAGPGNLLWMAALAAVMAYEAMGRHGSRAASAVGTVLVGFAGLVVLSGGAVGVLATG
ncbi:MAG: DUF2182 domain-containing protein [Candidatus Limnocylindria bacterium]